MINYSFLNENINPLSISQNKESYILNNIVYHGSPDKMSIIKGDKTRKSNRFDYDCVFVTSFKYIASHFIIEKEDVFNEILKRYPHVKKSIHSINGGYSTDYYVQFSNRCKNDKSFRYKAQTSIPKEVTINVEAQDKNNKSIRFKNFDMNYSGYIHYIDYNGYKDNSFQDHDYPFEFVIKGNVRPFKIEKVNVLFHINCFTK